MRTQGIDQLYSRNEIISKIRSNRPNEPWPSSPGYNFDPTYPGSPIIPGSPAWPSGNPRTELPPSLNAPMRAAINKEFEPLPILPPWEPGAGRRPDLAPITPFKGPINPHLPPVKPGEKLGELPEGYSFERIASKDLDKRTPPPIPMMQAPSPPLSPHNPNPPGGGPYTIRPGERLGELPEGYSFERLAKAT